MFIYYLSVYIHAAYTIHSFSIIRTILYEHEPQNGWEIENKLRLKHCHKMHLWTNMHILSNNILTGNVFSLLA